MTDLVRNFWSYGVVKQKDRKESITDPIEKKSTIFFPNLDGLRFFCFLSVFLHHSAATDNPDILSNKVYNFFKVFLFTNGNLGVNFFFVLSGFLITYLLLTEKKKYGDIKIGNFYVRRILRIWPLFYFCVIFGFFVFPQLKMLFGETSSESASLLSYITFTNNFDYIYNIKPDSSTLAVLWSVAIEEQFYLCWPIFLILVPRRFYLHLFVVLILASFCFRFLHAGNRDELDYHTLACISDMTVGGLFAYLSITSKKFIAHISSAPIIYWRILYVLIAVIFLFRANIFNHGSFLLAVDRLFISILFALVIVEQNYAKNSFYKMSRFPVLTKLGTYTYGLYCLHMIGILIVTTALGYFGYNNTLFEILFIQILFSLGITILLAILSYKLFESKFLKLKTSFARITK